MLKGASVRLSWPGEFNDPFEVGWDMHHQIKSREGRSRLAALAVEVLSGRLPVHKDAESEIRSRVQFQIDRLAKFSLADRERAFNQLRSQAKQPFRPRMPGTNLVAKRARVFCLSKRPDEILMWSHYAAQHRGIVLEFDAEAVRAHWATIAPRLRRVDVKYPQSYPTTFDAARLDSFIRSAMAAGPAYEPRDEEIDVLLETKSRHWKYEQEVRFYSFSASNVPERWIYLGLPKGSITAVIGGCRCPTATVAALTKLARTWNPNVSTRVYDTHPNRFTLNLRRDDAPNPRACDVS